MRAVCLSTQSVSSTPVPLRRHTKQKSLRQLQSKCASQKASSSSPPKDNPDEASLSSPPGKLLRRRDLAVSTIALATAISTAHPKSSFADVATESLFTSADLTPNITPSAALSSLENSTVDIFTRSTKSVVNVIDLTILSAAGSRSSSAGGVVPEGNGTGIVWDKDGHIITNYHVIGSMLSLVPKGRSVGEVAKVTVELPDGSTRTFGATLTGAEKRKDLVVLKINAPADILIPLAVGSSSAVRIGQVRCCALFILCVILRVLLVNV